MAEKNTEISIIVCVYNTERFLNRCLESLRNQSFADFEVITVDDGSTDGSAAICREYSTGDVRFRYAYRENGGLNAARETGLQLANGRYVCFVDSDDYVEPDFLETLYHAIVSTGSDIVRCGYAEEYATYSLNINRNQEFWGFSNKIFRRDILTGLSFPSVPFAEDILVFMQIFDRHPKIADINNILYHWVQNENPIRLSLSFNETTFHEGMRALKEVRSLISDDNVYEIFRIKFTTLYAFRCILFNVFPPSKFRKEFKGCLGIFIRSKMRPRRKLILVSHWIGLSTPLLSVRKFYILYLKKYLRKG